MGKKKKQREEMIQNQHSDYTKPAEYKILKKKKRTYGRSFL